MKIAFFGARDYDIKWFEEENKNYGHEIKFLRPNLTDDTVSLAKGYDAVCAFVNAEIDAFVLNCMKDYGIKLLLMRCAGYNNVDLKCAKENEITILRVPGYSPEAVAEHAMALALTANRRIHKAYFKVKDNNFSLTGLCGKNLYKKTAGIIGTGRIGAAMARICRGFGMEILAYDIYENPEIKDFAKYVSLDELLKNSDLISLHCPLTKETMHIINEKTISKMKDGVIIVNNSRGQMVVEQDLADALNSGKVAVAAVDVVSSEPITGDNPLLTAKNCIITPHISWASKECRQRIIECAVENAKAYIAGKCINIVNR